jgi:membrane associated rhomboid family serine protease
VLSDEASELFLLHYALVPRRYFDPAWAAAHGFASGDYWPLITGVFMHGGWWHLIINMWTLYIFGRSVEGRVGAMPFLIFYLLCGVAASFTHAFLNQGSTMPVLGASGAIAGVMGAYTTTFPRARISLLILLVFIPVFIKIPALVFTLLWFALQFVEGFRELTAAHIGGGIAWWAHIGGFAAGIVLIPLFRFSPNRTKDEDPVYWSSRWPFATHRPKAKDEVDELSEFPWHPGPWG